MPLCFVTTGCRLVSMSSTAARHHANIVAKADRAIEAIEARVATYTCDRAEGLERIRTALTGPDSERAWAFLATLHAKRFPNHPGLAEFDTSRSTILAKLDARIWTAGRPAEADPFAGLAA